MVMKKMMEILAEFGFGPSGWPVTFKKKKKRKTIPGIKYSFVNADKA